MNYFTQKLKAFLHDPVDKCFEIATHEKRAKIYAEKLGITGVEEAKGSDQIASCMERSLLPPNIQQDFNEIRHPLSDEKIEIPTFNKGEIFKSVEEVFELSGRVLNGKNEMDKFLYIWRNIQDEIFEKNKYKEWIKYLAVLPADTRLPDHSIWEHLKISSAISAYWDEQNKMLLQNNSLFIFTLGPVQSFISQARKTQDFFMGSFILSYLTFIGMMEIIKKYGPTSLIYPDLYKQPLMDWFLENQIKIDIKNSTFAHIELPTIPNRFVAIIPTTDESEIVGLIDAMKVQVMNVINEAKDLILNELNINLQSATDKKILSQFLEFPEIYYVAVKWRCDSNDISFKDMNDYFEDNILERYKNLLEFVKNQGEYPPNIGLLYEIIYSFLEKSIGARKNVRMFTQPIMEEEGRKCSVCGERDVVFFKESKNKNKFTRLNTDAVDLTDNKNVKLKYLADGEGLCSLCFIKRTFDIYLKKRVNKKFEDISFPSTAEIAISDFKEKAFEKSKAEFVEYQNILKSYLEEQTPVISPVPKLKDKISQTIEGEWFFEDNIKEDFIKKELDVSLNTEKVKVIKDSLKKLSDKIGKPSPYYAVIHLDGDNMGKWLSGDLLPEIENVYNSNILHKIETIEVEINDDNKKYKTNFIEAFKKYLPHNFSHLPRKLLTPAIHACISTALRNYSLEFVREIVEVEHLSKIIYAGGDDLLAFVNLKDLLSVMQKLRWAFSGQIRIENGKIIVDLGNKTGFVEKDGIYFLTMGYKATASMGVVIAHSKTPLQIVIRKVFEMEEVAKGNTQGEGKNGFSICLMKRSGEERIARAKWIFNDKDTIEILKILVNTFDEDNIKGYIAKSFIQKISTEFCRLKDEQGKFIGTADIFNRELLRLLLRSFNTPKGIKISDRDKKNFIEEVSNIMKVLFWEIEGNLDNFVNFCTIANFIHKREE